MAKAVTIMPRIVRMANPIISSPPIVLPLAVKSDVVGGFVDWVAVATVDTKKKMASINQILSVSYLSCLKIFITIATNLAI